MRELAMAIATELHAPLNLPVLAYLKHDFGHSQDEIDVWYRHWIARTFEGVEARLAQRGAGSSCSARPACSNAFLCRSSTMRGDFPAISGPFRI